MKDSYCEGVRDFLNSGEPSEWTTPLPYLIPVAVLAAVGSYGIRGSSGILSRAAVAAVSALVLHVLLLIVLPG